MQCPECNTPNDDGAAACTRCGLLLFVIPKPQRRREDLTAEKRRNSDARVPCPYCKGEIDPDVVRCRHCTQIVNAQFRVERSRRRRAAVNYSSWMSYLFGLAALLVFKPVGILAIAIGFFLSIVYYAIPIDREPDSLPTTLGGRVRDVLSHLFRFERVFVPIPHFPKLRLVFIGTPLLAALVGFLANFFLLQQPMNDVLSQSEAFKGMRVSTHYRYWVVPGVLVYDLRSIKPTQTRLDVHAALVAYAARVDGHHFNEVDLLYRGVQKFKIAGPAFRRIGEEYRRGNYRFALFEVPKLVRNSAGRSLDEADNGRSALLEFHNEWYANQVTRESAPQREAMEVAAPIVPSRTADRGSW